MTYPASGPVRLEANLGDYPLARALKAGEIPSSLVAFDFCGPKQANHGFKPMLREGKFDAGELALVTYLQALQYGKPLVLLPAVVLGHLQHPFLVYSSERHKTIAPKDLEGARVAVRAYSQTTGVWIRGVLQHEYGVDLNKITFLSWDDAHPAEYKDPANVVRVPANGKSLNQMLLDGDVEAAVPGADMLTNPVIRPVIPDPVEAAQRWSGKYGATPINHMFVVRKELCERRPDVVREIFRMLAQSKRAAPTPAGGVDRTRFGVEPNRRALELAVQYALEQKLIDRVFSVDELFDEVTRGLA